MSSNTSSIEGASGLERLAAAVDELAAQDLAELPAAQAARRVLVLRGLLERLQGQWLRELAAVDARGAAGADQGTRADSTAGWLRGRLRGGVADPDGAEGHARHRHEQRGLSVSPTFEGMVAVDGLLDPEGGETLLAALEPLARPTGAEDGRSGPQRRADALTELARRAMEGGRLPQAGGVRPQLTVTVALASLLGQPGLPARTGWRHDCGPRWRCCRRPLVAPRPPLEVGRTVRVVSAAQRTALAVRDGGCSFPGCDRPPAWCDAHHLRHWLHGGPTDLANLVLLCRAHHRAVHEGGRRLHRDRGGGLTATPPHRRRPAAA